MQRIVAEITGKTPLLLHKFTDAAALQATTGTTLSTNGDRGTPREQAEACLYHAPDGETLIIPQPNLFSCIIEGGKFFKMGRSKVTTQKSSLVPACVELEGLYYPIIHEQPWEVDTRPVRIPSTGGRILRHRPIFNDWALRFEINVDTEMMGVSLVRDIVDAAGSRVGLGDFRPATKGPYGRFRVTHWDLEG